MKYSELQTSNGPYFIDYELLFRTISDCSYIISLERGEPKRMSDSGPAIFCVDVDWVAARKAKEAGPRNFMSHYRIPNAVTEFIAQSSLVVDASEIERLRWDLYELEKKAFQASQSLKDKRNAAAARGMVNIEASVKRAKAGVAIAKFVRDTSIDGVLLGGTVLTGGALPALAGLAAGGALLKGTAKYQDTGNVAASVLTAQFEFLTALIPGPAKGAGIASKIALVFTKKATAFQGDMVIGFAEGKSLTESATGAAINFGLGFAGNGLKSKAMGELEANLISGMVLKDQLVPVAVSVIGGNGIESKLRGSANDALTSQIMTEVKGRQAARKSMPLKEVSMALPLRVDYAVVGPYVSTAPRTA